MELQQEKIDEAYERLENVREALSKACHADVVRPELVREVERAQQALCKGVMEVETHQLDSQKEENRD